MIIDSLRWLGRIARNIPLPLPVHWESCTDASFNGLYLGPTQTIYLMDGQEFECPHGIIVVNATYHPATDREIANTLAHEFRHHLQSLHYGAIAGTSWRACRRRTATYEEAIVDFFRRSPRELDALLFSHKVAPSETSGRWIDLLRADKARRRLTTGGVQWD